MAKERAEEHCEEASKCLFITHRPRTISDTETSLYVACSVYSDA